MCFTGNWTSRSKNQGLMGFFQSFVAKISCYTTEFISLSRLSTQLVDVGCAVHLCSLLHRRYPEFSGLLLEQLQKIYSPPIKKDDDRSATVTKFRLGLRFLGEVQLLCVQKVCFSE